MNVWIGESFRISFIKMVWIRGNCFLVITPTEIQSTSKSSFAFVSIPRSLLFCIEVAQICATVLTLFSVTATVCKHVHSWHAFKGSLFFINPRMVALLESVLHKCLPTCAEFSPYNEFKLALLRRTWYIITVLILPSLTTDVWSALALSWKWL